MKQYRYDYHNMYGWNRAWIEAENEEEAMKKVLEECRKFRRNYDEGTLKEVENKTAAKDYTNQLFEQHAKSFVSGVDGE